MERPGVPPSSRWFTGQGSLGQPDVLERRHPQHQVVEVTVDVGPVDLDHPVVGERDQRQVGLADVLVQLAPRVRLVLDRQGQDVVDPLVDLGLGEQRVVVADLAERLDVLGLVEDREPRAARRPVRAPAGAADVDVEVGVLPVGREVLERGRDRGGREAGLLETLDDRVLGVDLVRVVAREQELQLVADGTGLLEQCPGRGRVRRAGRETLDRDVLLAPRGPRRQQGVRRVAVDRPRSGHRP